MTLSDNITSIKNLGPARAKAFAQVGVFSVLDLINFIPRDYEDRSVITKVSELQADLRTTIKAKVTNEPKNSGFRGIIATTILLEDETGRTEAVYFNQPYMKNTIKKGEVYYFSGKVVQKMGKVQIQSPDITKVTEDPLHVGRIIPIYPAKLGISQKIIRGYIKEALDTCADEITESLPEKVVIKADIMPRREALSNIHFPQSRDAFLKARERLIFEEFFAFQMALLSLKGAVKKQITDVRISSDDYSAINLPFKLTGAQQRTLEQIIADINSPHPMYRLVQGDVGSGKTIVAGIAAYLAIKSGYQAAIMAPTEVLAKQHLESFTKLFAPLGIEVCLINGSMKASEKKEVLAKVADGTAKMVVGTHALIQERTQFFNLGLVITDEQHRFGVNQRIKLTMKSDLPHVLVMSATPIPRSLALVLYGDMDISVMDELPPGRQEISTFALKTSYRERAYNFIDAQIEEGRQAYIICPSIEESEALEVENVMEYAARLKNDFLPKHNIAVLHGKMKSTQKEDVMERFAAGEISILVSTTVIEVGVNVPNSTVMVIENAERFGLSQLHQLRGRVGRGADKSYCILFSDSEGEIAKERLAAMQQTGDGFKIAELDLTLRGPGDFFGTRQHGLPELRIGDIVRDSELLARARAAALECFEEAMEDGGEMLERFLDRVSGEFGKGF